MGNCIHGVNYDAVKNTVAVYGVYKTFILFFSVFSTSFHCMGSLRSVFVLRSYYGTKCPVPFLRILPFLRINGC